MKVDLKRAKAPIESVVVEFELYEVNAVINFLSQADLRNWATSRKLLETLKHELKVNQ